VRLVSVAELAPREDFERTPPHDIAAEQCVLGGMLLSKDAISDVLEVIKPADHYRPAHQIVHETILDLYSRGEPADAVTVAAELTKTGDIGKVGGAPYLHTLIASVPTAANAGYYARIVRERAIKRRLVEVGTRIVQLGYAGEGEVDELVDRAQAEVYGVTERRVSDDYLPLSEIMPETLVEIEAIGSRGGTMTGVPTGFADLDSLTNGLHPGQMIVIAARPALGKALALDTPLATPRGWTTMGEVAPGDELLGANGRPVRVVAATEVMYGRPCCEVEFSDGEIIVADGQHQWLTWSRAARRYDAQLRGHQRQYARPVPPAIVTTEQIAATLRCQTVDDRPNHAVALCAPLQLPEADLPIPPYALGCWLGDEQSAGARITAVEPELVMHVESTGVEVVPQQSRFLYRLAFSVERELVAARQCVVCGRSFVPKADQVRTCGKVCRGKARFSSEPSETPKCIRCGMQQSGQLPGSGLCRTCWRRHGTLHAELRELGVLGNKHIPLAYLRASEVQRRELLAGILDTDGTVGSTGSVQVAVTNRELAIGVRELVLSLGYRCSMTTKQVKGRTAASSTCYMVNFTTADTVFKLSRKQAMHKQRSRHSPQRTRWRYITAVRTVPSIPVRCVQVDSPDRLYLAGTNMIPTHNSTLALDLARAASIKHGLTSVMFSLEMSRNEITMRLLSAEARVALHSMRTGQMSEDDWTRLARRMGEVANAPMFIDDSPNMSMMEIRAKCRRLKQQNDLRLVIIDYLQLMTSPKRVENRQQEVSELSRSLKLLAKELNVPVIAVAQLNRGPEQRTDKRPMLSDLRESGCLTADTRIVRADTGAEVRLGDLARSGQRDIPVWSLDDRLKLVASELTHAFPTGTKQVFQVRLRSGREVTATANHPFLTLDGWRELRDLGVGTRVAVPRQLPAPLDERALPDGDIILLARLLGDGSFVRNQPPVARGRRNPVAAWLDSLGLCGLRSHQKFVPDRIFALPRHQVAMFLRHLWSADGCVWWDEKVGQARIYYASTSRTLVHDVGQLLLRFNVMTRVKEVRKGSCRPGYQLHIYGAENQLRFVDEIGVHGARAAQANKCRQMLSTLLGNTNIDTIPREVWQRVRAALVEQGMSQRQFAASTGTQFCGTTLSKHAPSRSRLSKVAAVLDDVELDLLATNDVFWDEIALVTSLGEQEVYDATVAETHNFIANGICLHNSIEQDSDVVILLHREDAYERESPRAGEADFIIAKHRNGPTTTVTVAFQGHYSRFVDMARI
jgi:replicative DNA helicase